MFFLNLGRQQSDTPLILGAKNLFANSLKSLENFCLTIDISNNGLDPFCRTDKTFPHLSLSCIWTFWIGQKYMFYVLFLKLRHRLCPHSKINLFLDLPCMMCPLHCTKADCTVHTNKSDRQQMSEFSAKKLFFFHHLRIMRIVWIVRIVWLPELHLPHNPSL